MIRTYPRAWFRDRYGFGRGLDWPLTVREPGNRWRKANRARLRAFYMLLKERS